METFHIVDDTPETQDPLDDLLTSNIGYPKIQFGKTISLQSLQNFSTLGPAIRAKHLNSDCLVSVSQNLGGVYWITFSSTDDKLSFLKTGLLDCLTVVPLSNPMNPVAMKPISMLQSHPKKPNLIGVPRFWGLSTFGNADSFLDHRKSNHMKAPIFRGSLRPLQIRCNEQAKAMLQIWGGTTLLADCGFGKTATSIALACDLNQKCLILCNREILMHQWMASIQQFVPEVGPIGYIQGGSFDKGPPGSIRPIDPGFEHAYFVVGSIESIGECGQPKELLQSFGTVIVDEMHHIAAQSLVHVLPMLPAKQIVGLTATPKRSDGLEQVLQWLAGPTSFVQQRLPSITGIRGSVEIEAQHFSKGQQKEIVQKNGNLGFSKMMTLLSEDPQRNDFLEELIGKALNERQKVIVVTSHVAHSKYFFDKKLHPLQAIMAGSFQMPVEAKAKETRLVYATQSLLEEGYDDPRLDALVLAMPRSKIQQTVGRIERTHEGKLVPKVQDLVDLFSLMPAMATKRKTFFESRGFLQTILLPS